MTDEGGQWVTVAQAAQALGVSQRTVRRWAQIGKLEIRRDCRPHVVDIAGQTPDTSDATTGRGADLGAEIARLHERIEELRAERDYLRALAGSLAQDQRLMLEARPRRRWRWPWRLPMTTCILEWIPIIGKSAAKTLPKTGQLVAIAKGD